MLMDRRKDTHLPNSPDQEQPLQAPHPASLPAKPSTLREAARAADLPDRLALKACLHGGNIELGDVGATEADVMASSGPRAPDAARLEVERAEAQGLNAARKRKALREDRSG